MDLKPPHFDEGINGWFADRVKEQGFYAYDPTNYHGPLFFYILFLAQNFFGRSLWVLRIPAVLASIMTVWLAFRFEPFLGKSAARWGALTLACSPAMVFYGRYAIHESWVAASLMILVLGLFGLWSLGDRRSLFLTLSGMTLLILLKETAVIHFTSLFLTAALLLLWHRRSVSKSLHPAASTTSIQEPKSPRMIRLLVKLAGADEVQGASGAQTRSVQEVLENASTVVQQFVCKLVALGLFDFSTSVSC